MGGAEAAQEGLARAPVEVAVAQAVLEEGLARAPVEVAAAAQVVLEEGLARAPVGVAVAQAGLEEGLARAPVEVTVAAQVALEQGLARAPVGRAAEARPSVAAVSGAREANPVNGWRLRPCCAAPRWAGWGEQEASALA